MVRKQRDAAVISAVAEQLGASASSLGAVELVRGFSKIFLLHLLMKILT